LERRLYDCGASIAAGISFKNEFDQIQAPQEIAGFFIPLTPKGESGSVKLFKMFCVIKIELNLLKQEK